MAVICTLVPLLVRVELYLEPLPNNLLLFTQHQPYKIFEMYDQNNQAVEHDNFSALKTFAQAVQDDVSNYKPLGQSTLELKKIALQSITPFLPEPSYSVPSEIFIAMVGYILHIAVSILCGRSL